MMFFLKRQYTAREYASKDFCRYIMKKASNGIPFFRAADLKFFSMRFRKDNVCGNFSFIFLAVQEVSKLIPMLEIGSSIQRRMERALDSGRRYWHENLSNFLSHCQVQKFRDRILLDHKKSKKELEYILILVDRT